MVIRAHAVEDSFEAMGRQIGDLMNQLSSRSYYKFSRSPTWQPAVNVYEEQGRFVICAELAGLDKEQIHVEALGDKIRIRGERPAPSPSEDAPPDGIRRMEIDSGPFERTIELPAEADMGTVEARLDRGFLWIRVGKRSC